jgi:LCP family protein required for cell wall assembly
VSEETPEPPEPSSETPEDIPSGRVRRSTRVRILRAALATFVVFVLLISGGVAYAVHHYNGNITTLQSESSAPDVIRPPDPTPSPSLSNGKPVKVKHQALNILILGSDTRDGANSFIGEPQGPGRSDTAIVLHLSADRKWSVGVSIPRDSEVQIPDCRKPDGTIQPGGLGMFNEAYAIGGAVCARDTVEQLTGLRMDHFLVVDFEGFKSMVSALGGVDVCVAQPIDDSYTHLKLAAGEQKLNGLEALQYVRLRHVGSGSDLDRIKRQQGFISALIQQVTSARMFFHLPKLLSFLNAATNSLTTDKGLASASKLATLANQVRSIGLDNIQFVTVPTGPYPPDHNRLVWTSGAATLWKYLYNDQPLPGTKAARLEAGPSVSPSPSPTPTPTSSPLVAAPATINVKVLNGSGRSGAATKAANELRALGYNVVGVGDTTAVTSTVIRWSTPRDESARTLAAATGATTEQATGLGQTVELVVGPDYTSAHSVTVSTPTNTASPTPSASFGGINAEKTTCAS